MYNRFDSKDVLIENNVLQSPLKSTIMVNNFENRQDVARGSTDSIFSYTEARTSTVCQNPVCRHGF